MIAEFNLGGICHIDAVNGEEPDDVAEQVHGGITAGYCEPLSDLYQERQSFAVVRVKRFVLERDLSFTGDFCLWNGHLKGWKEACGSREVWVRVDD